MNVLSTLLLSSLAFVTGTAPQGATGLPHPPSGGKMAILAVCDSPSSDGLLQCDFYLSGIEGLEPKEIEQECRRLMPDLYAFILAENHVTQSGDKDFTELCAHVAKAAISQLQAQQI